MCRVPPRISSFQALYVDCMHIWSPPSYHDATDSVVRKVVCRPLSGPGGSGVRCGPLLLVGKLLRSLSWARVSACPSVSVLTGPLTLVRPGTRELSQEVTWAFLAPNTTSSSPHVRPLHVLALHGRAENRTVLMCVHLSVPSPQARLCVRPQDPINRLVRGIAGAHVH